MWGKQILPGKFGNDYFLRKLCPTQEFHITNRGVGDAGIEDAYSRIDDHNHNHNHDHNNAVIDEHRCSHAHDEHTHTHDHSHGHGHSHVHTAACTNQDPHHVHTAACTNQDPHHVHTAECSHLHHHQHHDAPDRNDMTTAQMRFGITSFVYRRRRPFHPARLTAFLKTLGKLSVSELSDLPDFDSTSYTTNTTTTPDVVASPLVRPTEAEIGTLQKVVLRSKGFVWIGSSQRAAYYVSHAGQHLELSVLGRWWADIDAKDWPTEASLVAELTADFDGLHGDRRQEIVFIGSFGAPPTAAASSASATARGDEDESLMLSPERARIESLLDECLLTDEEMSAYSTACLLGGDKGLATLFGGKQQQ